LFDERLQILSTVRRHFTPTQTLPHQGGGAIYLPQ
jgi:hypothetical protein